MFDDRGIATSLGAIVGATVSGWHTYKDDNQQHKVWKTLLAVLIGSIVGGGIAFFSYTIGSEQFLQSSNSFVASHIKLT
jgi:phosphate/sulfate permease